MKTMKTFAFGLACLILLSTCNQDEDTTFFRISQGIYFCNCFGECLTTLRAANGEVLLQTHQGCDATTALVKSCQDFFAVQDFDALTRLADWDAFRALDETIGCPDCESDGGEWIEISRGGEVHRVTFEMDAPPEELVELSAALREIIAELLSGGGC